MKKLVVFGDSFMDSHSDRNYFDEDSLWQVFLDDKRYLTTTWTYQLAKKLNTHIFNYGVFGSSVEFSLVKFVEYINSEQYDPEDIIVFGLSSPERFALEFNIRNWPSSGCWLGNAPKDSRWYKSNEKHLKWLLVNTPNETLELKTPMVISFLQSWANNIHKGKLIVVPCFGLHNYNGSLDDSSLADMVITHTDKTVVIRGNLNHISGDEFPSPAYCFNHYKNFKEFRTNHLSLANHAILADVMYSVIDTMDPSKFDKELFATNIYTTPLNSSGDLVPYLKAKVYHPTKW